MIEVRESYTISGVDWVVIRAEDLVPLLGAGAHVAQGERQCPACHHQGHDDSGRECGVNGCACERVSGPAPEGYPGIKVLTFEVEGIDRPGRVYSHPAHDADRPDRMVVAFNEPAPLEEIYDTEGKPKRSTLWSGMPTMFLYVHGFREALALAREIGEAHRRGDVTAYVARWKRECAEAEERSRSMAPAPAGEGGTKP